MNILYAIKQKGRIFFHAQPTGLGADPYHAGDDHGFDLCNQNKLSETVPGSPTELKHPATRVCSRVR